MRTGRATYRFPPARLTAASLRNGETIPREMSSRSASVSASRDERWEGCRHVATIPCEWWMWLAISTPDLMQRLTGFPTDPDVGSLARRKSHPFSLGHRHPSLKETFIRWCCIDLSNPPRLPGLYVDIT